jgi:hypothetical protein
MSLAGCKPQSFHQPRLFATPDITTHHEALSSPSCCSEIEQPPVSFPPPALQYRTPDIMASIQLVKQRNVQTRTTTKLDQVQSLQLVQTMLHSALSTLTYLRNLFPDRAFVQRRYEMRDTVMPYAEYAAARMPSVNDDAEIPYTNVPILVRAHSRRADVFLDWLVSGGRTFQRHSTNTSQEKGAFPELESGDLRAVQIATKCWRLTHSSSATLSQKTGGAHQVQWSQRLPEIKGLPLPPRTPLCKSFCATWTDSATISRNCHLVVTYLWPSSTKKKSSVMR